MGRLGEAKRHESSFVYLHVFSPTFAWAAECWDHRLGTVASLAWLDWQQMFWERARLDSLGSSLLSPLKTTAGKPLFSSGKRKYTQNTHNQDATWNISQCQLWYNFASITKISAEGSVLKLIMINYNHSNTNNLYIIITKLKIYKYFFFWREIMSPQHRSISTSADLKPCLRSRVSGWTSLRFRSGPHAQGDSSAAGVWQ